MYKLIVKYNNLISFPAKLFISFGATYYLWHHRYFSALFRPASLGISTEFWIVLLGFSLINWMLEIKKWQFLASHVRSISLLEAARQSLTGFAISLLTPNRIGEYGVKILFFNRKEHKKIFSLNLIGNLSQLIITIIFGWAGIVFWSKNHWLPEEFSYFQNFHYKWVIIPLLLSLLYLLYKKWGQNFFILFNNTNIWKKSLLFALLRYLTFSTQYILLLYYFTNNMDWKITISGIFITYFLSSLIPMLSIFDWAVKGSIAVWILGSTGIEQSVVFKVSMLMWAVNFMLPLITGIVWMWIKNKERK